MALTSTDRITAVFDDRTQAEQAITALRQIGIDDNRLSIVSRHDADFANDGTWNDNVARDDAKDEAKAAGERAGKGALAGAGVGVLFGLAALAIPGVGPFVTAGFLAPALGATAGAAVSGAVVGATTGAIAGAFAKAGYDEHEAQYYGSAVERGGTVVAVDTTGDGVPQDQIWDVLSRYGGRFAGTRLARAA